MTNEEALKIINVNGCNTPENVNQEAHDIINHEMSYRIATAPKEKEGGTTSLFGEALCPICGNLVFGTEKFCSECGQALKWEAKG